MPTLQPVPYKLAYLVERARLFCAWPTRYALGKGGFDPRVEPGELTECDCSGFQAAVAGLSRHQANKGKPWSRAIPWFETTAIFQDAMGDQLLVARLDGPVKGCWIVNPDDGRKEGHIALVTKAENGRLWGIDCSGGFTGTVRRLAVRERDITAMTARPHCFCCLREHCLEKP